MTNIRETWWEIVQMAIRIPTVHSSMWMYYVLLQYHGLQNIHSQGNDWPEGQDIAKYASSTVKNKSLAGITNFINSFKILLNINIPAPKSVKYKLWEFYSYNYYENLFQH